MEQAIVDDRFKSLLTWSFKGRRFDDHTIDLADLKDLVLLREFIVEVAKALWYRDNPERERVSPNAEEEIQLRMSGIGEGSAPIDVHYLPHPQTKLPPPFPHLGTLIDRLPLAANALVECVRAAEKGTALPTEMPRSLLGKFAGFATTLASDEKIEVSTPTSSAPATLDARTRELLVSAAVSPWTDAVDVIGEVTRADVQRGRASLIVDGMGIDFAFAADHEKAITQALHAHEATRVRIRGRGGFDADTGRLAKVIQIERLEVIEGLALAFRADQRPIWEVAAAISASVAPSDWDKLPTDGARNVDQYLTGRKKPTGGG